MKIRRRAVGWLVVAAVLVLGAGAANAARSARHAAPVRVTRPSRTTVIDVDRRIDVNNVNMFVANNGAFGYDLSGTYNGGFFYPNHTSKTAIYAAGLWVGGKVGSEVRLAVAEYDQEYERGRILPPGVPEDPGGATNTDLIVYKVKGWNGIPADTAHIDNPYADPDRGEDPLVHHSWNEYINGAKPYGAPTKLYKLDDTSTPAPGDSILVEGPALPGTSDQMLWCVYNDANFAAHLNEASAGTSNPLGIQVDQTTFAFDRNGPLGNTVFVKYKITNLSGATIDSMFVSQWADVDLGQFTHDLVGCDTLPDVNGHPRSLGYVYNGSNRDDIYGDVPPALGIDFLKGPIVGPDTLGLSSFAKYINGTDPLDASTTYNYMRGYLTDNGPGPTTGNPNPIIDPFGKITRYMVAGDPLLPSAGDRVDNKPPQ